jgi:hypothetical protein
MSSILLCDAHRDFLILSLCGFTSACLLSDLAFSTSSVPDDFGMFDHIPGACRKQCLLAPRSHGQVTSRSQCRRC